MKHTEDTQGKSIRVRGGVDICGREDFLLIDSKEHKRELFKKHEQTGRPLGEDSFIEHIELLLDRKLKPQKPGPKKKNVE